jgi:hypothetical protein
MTSEEKAGLKQCPTCGRWDVRWAKVKNKGYGSWCPHCEKFVKVELKAVSDGFLLVLPFILVVLVLACIYVPGMSNYGVKSYNSSAQADLRNCKTEQEAYYRVNKTYALQSRSLATSLLLT